MVLGGALRVFLFCLLSLCLGETGAQRVDQNTLTRIISHLEKYSPGPDKQYAVAINIPAHMCASGFHPDGSFLAGDKPDDVKNHFNKEREIYQSPTMVGAMPKDSLHSEYRLLNPPNPDISPMKNLLNQNKDGCVIFYSFYSPCLGTCLNATNTGRNILTALDMFKHHGGPKAFVFAKFFGKEAKDVFKAGFTSVNDKIFLYHCENNQCNSCFDTHKNIFPGCLPK